jgi:cell division protein FtsB
MSVEHSQQALDEALQRVARSERRARRNTLLATLVPLVFGLAFLVVSYSQVASLREEKKRLDTEVAALRNEEQDLQQRIAEKQRKLDEKQEQVELLEPLAGEALGRKKERIVGESADILEGARAANQAAQLAARADEYARRQQITITHYEKSLAREVDLDVVVRSLKKFGFKVQSKESRLQDLATNAIWFGKDVTDDDVRLVALTLMGAGVEIRWISRFSNWEGPKRSTIEIGSWVRVVELTPWSTQAVTDVADLAEVGNPAHPEFRPR